MKTTTKMLRNVLFCIDGEVTYFTLFDKKNDELFIEHTGLNSEDFLTFIENCDSISLVSKYIKEHNDFEKLINE